MTELWINCTSDPTETSKYEVLTAAIKKKKKELAIRPTKTAISTSHSFNRRFNWHIGSSSSSSRAVNNLILSIWMGMSPSNCAVSTKET